MDDEETNFRNKTHQQFRNSIDHIQSDQKNLIEFKFESQEKFFSSNFQKPTGLQSWLCSTNESSKIFTWTKFEAEQPKIRTFNEIATNSRKPSDSQPQVTDPGIKNDVKAEEEIQTFEEGNKNSALYSWVTTQYFNSWIPDRQQEVTAVFSQAFEKEKKPKAQPQQNFAILVEPTSHHKLVVHQASPALILEFRKTFIVPTHHDYFTMVIKKVSNRTKSNNFVLSRHKDRAVTIQSLSKFVKDRKNSKIILIKNESFVIVFVPQEESLLQQDYNLISLEHRDLAVVVVSEVKHNLDCDSVTSSTKIGSVEVLTQVQTTAILPIDDSMTWVRRTNTNKIWFCKLPRKTMLNTLLQQRVPIISALCATARATLSDIPLNVRKTMEKENENRVDVWLNTDQTTTTEMLKTIDEFAFDTLNALGLPAGEFAWKMTTPAALKKSKRESLGRTTSLKVGENKFVYGDKADEFALRHFARQQHEKVDEVTRRKIDNERHRIRFPKLSQNTKEEILFFFEKYSTRTNPKTGVGWDAIVPDMLHRNCSKHRPYGRNKVRIPSGDCEDCLHRNGYLNILLSDVLWNDQKKDVDVVLSCRFQPIQKNPDKEFSYRPITVASIFVRALSAYINEKLQDVLVCDGSLKYQQGFIKGRKPDAAKLLRSELSKGKCAVLIDISQAFDSVSWDSVHRTERRRLPTELADLHRYFRFNLKVVAYSEDGTEFVYYAYTGVAQGLPDSPSVFNDSIHEVYLDSKKENAEFIAFADDILVIADNYDDLDRKLNVIKRNLLKVGLKMNHDKTEYIGPNHHKPTRYLGVWINNHGSIASTYQRVDQYADEIMDMLKESKSARVRWILWKSYIDTLFYFIFKSAYITNTDDYKEFTKIRFKIFRKVMELTPVEPTPLSLFWMDNTAVTTIEYTARMRLKIFSADLELAPDENMVMNHRKIRTAINDGEESSDLFLLKDVVEVHPPWFSKLKAADGVRPRAAPKRRTRKPKPKRAAPDPTIFKSVHPSHYQQALIDAGHNNKYYPGKRMKPEVVVKKSRMLPSHIKDFLRDNKRSGL